jgi:succinate dehydrogenase/fumarate reductase flavoprotein subunit
MQFEDLDPGDEAQRYGHYLYLTAAEAVEAGQAVTVDSNGDAALLSAGDDVAGVAYIDAAAGEELTIKTNGPVVAAVGPDAGAGISVGSHDGTGAGAGELGDEGDEYMVLEVDGNGYALVAQRP